MFKGIFSFVQHVRSAMHRSHKPCQKDCHHAYIHTHEGTIICDAIQSQHDLYELVHESYLKLR